MASVALRNLSFKRLLLFRTSTYPSCRGSIMAHNTSLPNLACGNYNTTVSNSWWRSMATFTRTKSDVNVRTTGHVDHGKTTLTDTITKLELPESDSMVSPGKNAESGNISIWVILALAVLTVGVGVISKLELPESVEMVLPGEHVTATTVLSSAVLATTELSSATPATTELSSAIPLEAGYSPSDKDIESEASLWDLYERWRARHAGKVTQDLHEKQKRFHVFKENSMYINKVNKMNLGYTLGLNQFSDMTDEEFNDKMLNKALMRRHSEKKRQ